jgi:O-acetyl-ADP-ribose deacetylase (regulator of RNase III)
MIEIKNGDLFKTSADALVNTVNTQGIMGKGIALQFKKAFPDMFYAYEAACKAGRVQIGKMHVYETGKLTPPRIIINFPTKNDWKKPSKRHFIEEGLIDLLQVIRQYDIKSLALPPLGCGLGGLKWPEVREVIERAFSGYPEIQVFLFEPGDTPTAAQMTNNTAKPNLTHSLASIIMVLHQYGIAGYESSWIEVQKLLYFLQEAGQKLRLQYEKGPYGPYADSIRHILNKMEEHYTVGYGDGKLTLLTQLNLLPGAVDEARDYFSSQPDKTTALERVARLIESFESPYGLELLATVHWVVKHENVDSKVTEDIVEAVQSWNKRKSEVMKPAHIKIALQRLQEQDWV